MACFFENAVSQVLVASGHNLYFHTFKEGKNRYEVDFLIQHQNRIIPIEVKSSSYSNHKSLDVFLKKYNNRSIDQVYLIYSKDLRVENNITYLPIYMTMFI